MRTPNGDADLLSGDDGPAVAVPSSLGMPPYGEDDAGTPYDLDGELAELGAPKPNGTGRDPDGCGARSPTKQWRPKDRSSSSKKNCEELANQTSKIMHDYQAYLAEISMDNRNGSSAEDEVDSANPRLASVHRAREDVIGSYEEKQTDMMEDGYWAPSVSFAAAGENCAAGGGQLQRAWVYDDNTGRDDESPFGSAGTYAQSFLRSRRAKRGMGMVAVAIVALVVLGVSVGNTRGEGSVAQLEEFDEEYKAEEMDKIEEDYEAQKQKAQADAYEQEVATAAQAQKEYYAEMERDDVPPTLSYSSGAVGETTKEDDVEKKPASSNAHLSAEEVDLYAGAVEKYQPAMFDRSYGYTGTTFVDAENWCSSMSMTLCPYEAICPDGAGGEPLGGYRRGVNSDFAWIPVLGHNDWVQAEVKESCNRYSDLVGDAPGWGINGEADTGGENVEALTRNIMCCKNPDEADTKGGELSGATDVASGVLVAKVTTKPPEPTSECMDDPTFVHANLKTCETFVAHVGRVPLHQSRCAQPTGITGKDGAEVLVKHFCRKSCGECGKGDPSDASPAAAHIDKHTQDVYLEEVNKWQPKMFDRTKGYTGTTYMDARVWCSSLSMSLCPLEAVCPGGVGSEPLGGYRRGVDSEFAWVPVAAGRPNEWVQVESRESCTTYSDMHDRKGPGWGIAGDGEGVGAETLTRNVMCCRNVM